MRQIVLLTIGFILACSQLFSQASDSDAHARMRQLEDFSKGVDTAKLESQRSRIPLWLGPDDDPTLAADVSQHEAPPAARKLASRAEHFSKKQQHEKAIAEFQRALEIDHQYYEAENNLAIEYFTAGQTDSAIHTLKHLTEPNRSAYLHSTISR